MYQTLLAGRKIIKSAFWSPSESKAVRKLTCASEGTVNRVTNAAKSAVLPNAAKKLLILISFGLYQVGLSKRPSQRADEPKIYYAPDLKCNKIDEKRQFL